MSLNYVDRRKRELVKPTSLKRRELKAFVKKRAVWGTLER